MKSSIVILSGGLDSSVLLLSLLTQARSVRALSINYGQRHSRELEHAALICKTLGVEHRTADLSALRPLLAGSSQTDDTVAVPHGHYAEETMKVTVVPNRNMLMLSVATAWAISTKTDSVAYGAHAGDHAQYPDCREEFCQPLAEAMANADWHRVALERPFLAISKADIVRLGNLLPGGPEIMAESYSCYEGGEYHCGRCGTCVERAQAFAEAGVVDRTLYKDYDYWKTVTAPAPATAA
jgi:7-cyano-7-deazaguanine synthase